MAHCDIVLINPSNQKRVYGDLSEFELTAIEPSFWLALLAGDARQKGLDIHIVDAEAESLTHEETVGRVRSLKPLIAAIFVSGINPTASTMNMPGAFELIDGIKNNCPGILTLIGGLHPSALPESTMAESVVDFVCQGEGFDTLPSLVAGIKAGQDTFQIEGLWYRFRGDVIKNPRPKRLAPLSDLPLPAWDLLPMSRYRAHNWHCFDNINERQPYGVLYTSLGCPFRCEFCCIHSFFGRHQIRYRPLDHVMDELDLLVNTYRIRNIKIIDEMFALNEERVVNLCDRIIQKKYDLNMWAYARVDTVTPKMLHKMKAAGINWVVYGFESANQQVVKEANKGIDVSRIKKVVDWTYDAGLYICSNFIFGLPGDDFNSMNETLTLMLDINSEWVNLYCAMAYPGSELYEKATNNKWPLPDEWTSYSQYGLDSSPLPTRHLKSQEVLAFRDYAFEAYFRNPRYLDKIMRTFGADTIRYIQKMTEYRIRRRQGQFC